MSQDDNKKSAPGSDKQGLAAGAEPALDDNQIIAERRNKLKAIRAAGNADPHDLRRHALADEPPPAPDATSAEGVGATPPRVRHRPRPSTKPMGRRSGGCAVRTFFISGRSSSEGGVAPRLVPLRVGNHARVSTGCRAASWSARNVYEKHRNEDHGAQESA